MTPTVEHFGHESFSLDQESTTMKAAIITGASSGIGEATAFALAEAGYSLALVARSADKLEQLKARLLAQRHDACVCPISVTDRAAMKGAAAACLDSFGSIDLLLNNAGIMPLSFLRNLHEEEWDRMIDVNIRGVLNGISAVLPAMIKQNSGHIINVSSIAALNVFPSSAVYSGTKFAVEAISEGLRMELSLAHGIRVTVVRPGGTATNLVSSITDSGVVEWVKALPDTSKLLDAKDIANAIVFAATQPESVSCNEITVRATRHSM
jgi:NADP-dependent 3-hydroxy acid dehydrogenase YdfG